MHGCHITRTCVNPPRRDLDSICNSAAVEALFFTETFSFFINLSLYPRGTGDKAAVMLAPQTQFVPPRKGAGLEEHLKWAFGRPPLTCTASTHSMCPPRPKEHPFSGGGKDRLATLEKIIGGEVVSLAMVGVGVGSAALVEWCTINALPNLVNAAGDDPSGPSLARAAQLVVEIAQREAGACAELTGCMLTMCAVNRTRSEVVTCHVGVAGAILFARGKQSSPRLTEDHMLATSAHEQRRLKERGVQLAPAQDAHGGACGPLRSWPGGLTCARIIGNLDREAPGVCAVPSLSIVPVPPGGADLLICSHGVWGELLDTHVASLVRASPCPDTAARLIVESAVQQHTSYYQEGYGVPLDDATVVMLRIGAVRAAPTHGLSEGKGERSRPSAFARLRQKLFPGAGTNGSSTPVCATPSDLSDASIRSGVSLMGAGGGEVWGNAPDSPTLPASPDGTIMEDVELEELDPLDEPGSSLAQQSMGSLAQSMGSLAVGDGSEIHVLRLIGVRPPFPQPPRPFHWQHHWPPSPSSFFVLASPCLPRAPPPFDLLFHALTVARPIAFLTRRRGRLRKCTRARGARRRSLSSSWASRRTRSLSFKPRSLSGPLMSARSPPFLRPPPPPCALPRPTTRSVGSSWPTRHASVPKRLLFLLG